MALLDPERQELREERRRRRREVTDGMKRGDERFLTARDRGPERALARDVVDSRRAVPLEPRRGLDEIRRGAPWVPTREGFEPIHLATYPPTPPQLPQLTRT